jgi:hypothetical protein
MWPTVSWGSPKWHWIGLKLEACPIKDYFLLDTEILYLGYREVHKIDNPEYHRKCPDDFQEYQSFALF